MTEQFQADPTEATQAAISMGLSTFNGVFALASVLARHGLMQKDDVEFLHHNMLQPLTNDGSSQEIMALQTKRLDELCALLALSIEQRGSA